MTQPRWGACIETHVSVVHFAGDLALKILKPVTTPFLDHSTLEARARAVEAELELNRRLSPDVYLGVQSIMVGGEAVEHVLVMRRMPADRRLSALVDNPDFNDELRRVAKRIAAFHASLPSDDEAIAIASLESERGRWTDNIAEIRELARELDLDLEVVDAIEHDALRYLEHRGDLFADRAAAGMCRDGHGDLLADDIFCLDDGPRILDCLAFATHLRKGDVLADIAFLVMDVERLAGPRAAQRLLRWYQEFTDEHHPPSLAHFYVAYRALVRAKIAAIRCTQTGDPLDVIAANDLFAMTHAHLQRARMRLVLVGGGPGSGKSTLSESIGQIMGWTVLSTDELRKTRAGVDPHVHRFAEPDQGLYRPEVTADTYAELCDEAATLLRRGESVVLDASWSRSAFRAAARATAAAAGADVVELECRLEPAVAKERIVRRMASPWTTSDATPEIVDHLESIHDPWPEAIGIDTSHPVGHCRSTAMKAVLGFEVG